MKSRKYNEHENNLQFRCHWNVSGDGEVSEDLRTWSALASLTITNLNGTVAITDKNAATSAHRFYRAVQLGQ